MKQMLITFLSVLLSLAGNCQFNNDIESIIKYPDELVCDKSLMNYTVYKPYTNIRCKYPVRQVSKTLQRTVFMTDGDSIKMSFAFFELAKLPFYNSSDSEFESAYKFYSWDSLARVVGNMPPITIIQLEKTKGILYYRALSGDRTNLYLVGTKNNLVSLILFSQKELDPAEHMDAMALSFSLNIKE